MRRDPDGTTGPIRTVACFGDRSTSPSTARSNRRGDPRRGCRGGPPCEGERASETRTRRVDERRATRRASTVTARVVRYEGTSMERWTTRARVGDGRRALASATTSDALEKDTTRFFIQIGTGRGIVAERAPSSPPSILRHTARRQKQKSARLASFVSALLRRREKKTTTTKTETRPRRD